MDADDLQQLIDAELKALPVPRAPETLLPRVLAAAAARSAAPWYSRPWLAWPRGWQVASLAAVGLLSVAIYFAWQAGWWLPAATTVATPAPGHSPGASTFVLDTATAMRLFWRLLLVPAAIASVVFTLVLSLVCAAIWAALDRVSLGASPQ